MVSIRHRSLLRPPWHPSTEDLLLWLDGEIKAKSHNKVEEHLKICWSCRMKRQKIECLISDYMEHRKVQRAVSPGFPSLGTARFRARLEQLELEGGKGPIFSNLIISLAKEVFPLRFSPRLAVCLLLCCFILLSLIRLSSVPPVSAKEFLRRTEYAEIQAIRQVPAPVVYQQLQVRRYSSAPEQERTEVWEIWNDASHNRFKQRVENANGLRVISAETHDRALQAPILAELEQILQANHMDRRKPLSPASYQAWRDSIRFESEKVAETKLAKGDRALELKTVAAGPFAPRAIIQAELVVRAQDWHPVKQSLKVNEENGVRDYQLTETAFKVLTLNTLTSTIFADLTPPSPAIPPQTRSVSSLPSPNPTELLTAEIEVCYALHRLKACLGEPLELVRGSSGRIEVQGLAETEQRKEELVTALQGIPLVTAKIQTVEEATIAPPLSPSAPMNPGEQAKNASSQEGTIVEVQSNKLPIQDQLERYFSQVQDTASSRQRQDITGSVSVRQKIAELSTKAVSLSDSLLAEAWALRRLAEQYPEWKTKNLRPATRWLLEVMLRDHLTRLRTQIGGYRTLVEPVLFSPGREDIGAMPSSGTEALSPPDPKHSGWVTTALHVFSQVEQIRRLTTYLFAAADLPGGQAEQATPGLLAALYQLDSDSQNLEIDVAREFSDTRDLLLLKERPR